MPQHRPYATACACDRRFTPLIAGISYICTGKASSPANGFHMLPRQMRLPHKSQGEKPQKATAKPLQTNPLMEQPLNKSPRIEAVDALRGFAVMAIILVHNLEHFIYPVYPANPPHWLAVLDQGVLSAVFALFAGKAYAIFALLFGFTFYI